MLAHREGDGSKLLPCRAELVHVPATEQRVPLCRGAHPVGVLQVCPELLTGHRNGHALVDPSTGSPVPCHEGEDDIRLTASHGQGG